ncbi:hypothetical protein AB0H76_15220 [Nocardia sp. NPDC050712]|uniref:hypothetical protein n=1 Tax=Nocardia sp. NPDC050712 TaxID=3155518 RepID=UPI0033DFBB7B
MSYPIAPRWWRLDPRSPVELDWSDHNRDVEEFSLTAPSRTLASRRCISLRPYKDDWFEGAWKRVYGAWRTFDLRACPDTQYGEIHGRTTIVDGMPMVDVFATDPPTVGEWRLADPTEEKP